MKSFLSGRSVHDQPLLRAENADSGPLARIAANHAHAPGQPAAGGKGPTVECVKQGDKIVRLIVTCNCGERIEIDCFYPSA